MLFSAQKPESTKPHTMQLEEDIGFFRKELIFQRLGWLMMLLLLILGCLGLFGTGILSHQKTENDTAAIEYEKFLRFENQSMLVIRSNQTTEHTTVGFPPAYLKRLRIEKTIPAVQSSHIKDRTTFYVFSATGSAEIRFFITPTETGKTAGIVTVNGKEISLSHFVYP